MSGKYVLDSDIITKLCLFLLPLWSAEFDGKQRVFLTLANSRFIIEKRLKKHLKSSERQKPAFTLFEDFASTVLFVEPTPDQIAMAASLELCAQRIGVAFDVGESQLITLLIEDQSAKFITGDKKAIRALPNLCTYKAELSSLKGRIICLEQLFIFMLAYKEGKFLQARVCSEPDADTSLRNCFQCKSLAGSDSDFREGLQSYIRDLRQNSDEMLCEDLSFSSAS